MWIIFTFGVLIGFLLGLLGGGGSILAVPVFVYLLELKVKVAVPMSLAVVGATSMVASIHHFFKKNIDLKIAAIFGVSAMAGAYGGAKISVFVSEIVQLILFACIMLITSFFMFTNNQSEFKNILEDTHLQKQFISLVLQGTCVGILSSIIGVGGGFLIIPALVLVAKLPMKKAVGTSLLVISMNSSVGFITHICNHVSIPVKETIAFTCFSIVGTFLGSYSARFFSPKILKKLFAIFVFIIAIVIIVETFLEGGKL